MTILRGLGSLVLGSILLLAAAVQAQDKAGAPASKYPVLLLIRHAEKTGDKEDNQLSAPGKERAKQLPLIFTKTEKRPDAFPIPDFIFAAHDSKDSERPRLTVTPLAMKLKIKIDDRFYSSAPKKNPDAPGAAQLRDELFKEPKYAGKIVLIAWRHGKLPELAKTLKAENAPTKWGDEVFDRVWKITYDAAGKATFVDLPQKLMPGDTAK